jgi:hypothetical protein
MGVNPDVERNALALFFQAGKYLLGFIPRVFQKQQKKEVIFLGHMQFFSMRVLKGCKGGKKGLGVFGSVRCRAQGEQGERGGSGPCEMGNEGLGRGKAHGLRRHRRRLRPGTGSRAWGSVGPEKRI